MCPGLQSICLAYGTIVSATAVAHAKQMDALQCLKTYIMIRHSVVQDCQFGQASESLAGPEKAPESLFTVSKTGQAIVQGSHCTAVSLRRPSTAAVHYERKSSSLLLHVSMHILHACITYMLASCPVTLQTRLKSVLQNTSVPKIPAQHPVSKHTLFSGYQLSLKLRMQASLAKAGGSAPVKCFTCRV